MKLVGGKPSSFQSCDLPDWGERGRAVKQAGKPAGTLEGQLPHALRGEPTNSKQPQPNLSTTIVCCPPCIA